MKKSKLFVLPLMAILLLAGCDNNTSSTSSSTSSSAPESSASSAQVSSSAASSSTPSSVSSSSSSSSVSSSESSSSISSSESSSSSSSSSEEEKVKHTFNTIISPKVFNRGGTYSLTFDKDSYAEGETATYTIIVSNSYYDIETFNENVIIVIGDNKIPFNVKSEDNTTFIGTFVMPKVDDAKESVDLIIGTYSIYKNSTDGEKKTLTFNVCNGLVAIAPSTFEAPSTFYSFSLYRTKTLSLTKISLKIGDNEAEDIDLSYVQWNDNFAEIPVRLEITQDTVINVEAKEVSAYSLTIVGGDFVTFSSSAAPSATYLEGENVYLSYTPISGYDVTYTIEGATNISYSTTTISFVMPSQDVTITFTAIAYPTVSVTTDENISSCKTYVKQYSSYIEGNKAKPGSTIAIIPEVKDGFKLGYAYIKGSESTKYTASSIYMGCDYSIGSIYKTGFEITVPSDGNDFEVVISTIKCGTISVTEDTTHFSEVSVKDSVSSSGESSLNSFGAGDTFVLFPTVKDGFVLTGATISDGTDSEAKSYNAGSYNGRSYVECTMPENGVANVTFTFENAYTVSIENESEVQNKVRIEFDSKTSKFAKGSNVKVNLTEQFGYNLTKLELVNGEASNDLIIETTSSGKYVEFIMPESNVTLKATIEESAKVSVNISYKNNSTQDVGYFTITTEKGGLYLSENPFVSNKEVDTSAEIVVGNFISFAANDYNAWDDSIQNYVQNFDFKLTITYNDNTTKLITATFEYVRYEISHIEVTDNIKSMSLVISDKAAA